MTPSYIFIMVVSIHNYVPLECGYPTNQDTFHCPKCVCNREIPLYTTVMLQKHGLENLITTTCNIDVGTGVYHLQMSCTSHSRVPSYWVIPCLCVSHTSLTSITCTCAFADLFPIIGVMLPAIWSTNCYHTTWLATCIVGHIHLLLIHASLFSKHLSTRCFVQRLLPIAHVHKMNRCIDVQSSYKTTNSFFKYITDIQLSPVLQLIRESTCHLIDRGYLHTSIGKTDVGVCLW